jgi:F0F1-type ATP synthase assembly protein I
MLAVQMNPAARPSFQPAAAGGVLVGVLLAAIAIGALVGWAAGSIGYGVLIGAIAGIPLAVFSVYRRYRGSF